MTSPLKTAREEAGLTQEQLAAKSGISRQTIIAMERGVQPMWRTARQLAEALGADPVALFPIEATRP